MSNATETLLAHPLLDDQDLALAEEVPEAGMVDFHLQEPGIGMQRRLHETSIIRAAKGNPKTMSRDRRRSNNPRNHHHHSSSSSSVLRHEKEKGSITIRECVKSEKIEAPCHHQ